LAANPAYAVVAFADWRRSRSGAIRSNSLSTDSSAAALPGMS